MTINSAYSYVPTSGAVSAKFGLGQPTKGAGNGDKFMDAAIAKLQQTDPALADKMQGFQKGIEDRKANGASKETIGQAMRSNFASLSDAEKSEVKAVMGGHHKHHGGPKPAQVGSSNALVPASDVAAPVQNQTVAQMLLQMKQPSDDQA